MTDNKRICRRCLLRDFAIEDQKDLRKYLERVRREDRAEDEEYERRLAVCRECSFLSEATCLACGCYAEFRALLKNARCPKKKW